jgi:hypothetical protein
MESAIGALVDALAVEPNPPDACPPPRLSWSLSLSL